MSQNKELYIVDVDRYILQRDTLYMKASSERELRHKLKLMPTIDKVHSIASMPSSTLVLDGEEEAIMLDITQKAKERK